jgi:uncharacterized Zn finger protein (UPF0148 family)
MFCGAYKDRLRVYNKDSSHAITSSTAGVVLYPEEDGRIVCPSERRESQMAEMVKKATTPRKPRATAPRKKANNLTQMTTQMTALSYEQVAQLAHRFWAERGCTHGHDAEDWFRAEQELLGKAS